MFGMGMSQTSGEIGLAEERGEGSGLAVLLSSLAHNPWKPNGGKPTGSKSKETPLDLGDK